MIMIISFFLCSCWPPTSPVVSTHGVYTSTSLQGSIILSCVCEQAALVDLWISTSNHFQPWTYKQSNGCVLFLIHLLLLDVLYVRWQSKAVHLRSEADWCMPWHFFIIMLVWFKCAESHAAQWRAVGWAPLSLCHWHLNTSSKPEGQCATSNKVHTLCSLATGKVVTHSVMWCLVGDRHTDITGLRSEEAFPARERLKRKRKNQSMINIFFTSVITHLRQYR